MAISSSVSKTMPTDVNRHPSCDNGLPPLYNLLLCSIFKLLYNNDETDYDSCLKKHFLVSFLISLLLKWRLLTEQQWSDISYPPQWILWPRPQWSPSTRLEQVPEKPDPKKRYTMYMFATTTEYFLMNCNRSNSGMKHRQRRVFRVFLIFLR